MLFSALVCPEIPKVYAKNEKRRGKFLGFVSWQFHLGYSRSRFLVLAVNATAHKVTTTIAAATETSAALLNSGTFGVELGVEEVELAGVAVVGVPEETGVTVTVPGRCC